MLKYSLLAGLLTLGLAQAQAVKNPGVIVEAVDSDWTSLDPVACYDLVCGEVLQNTLDTLIFYDGANPGKFIPWLATALPTKQNGGISLDGKTYTFKLRPGTKFSDGTPLTAQDVVYSFQRMLVASSEDGAVTLLTEPLFGDADYVRPGKKFSWDLIQKAVKANGNDVVFTLTKPFSPFLSVVALPYFAVYSKADALKRGEWDGTQASWEKFNNPKLENSKFAANPPIGSGPFALERYDVGKTLTLKRNDNFWQAPAKLSRVIFEVVKDENTRIQMLKVGDADLVGFTRAQVPQVSSFPGVVITDNIPNLGLDFVFMNEKVDGEGTGYLGSGKLDGKGIPANFFSDLNVRKGFAASMDYGALVNDIYQGKATQNNSILIRGIAGFNPNAPKYKFDKATATRAFKAAFGGQVWANGFVLPVFYNSGNTTRQRILELLKRGIEGVDPKFKVEVRELSRSVLFAQRSSGKMTLALGNWTADYADPHNFAFPLLASSGAFPGIVGYKNAALDTLIDKAVDETDPTKRVRLYAQIQRAAFNDVVHIPLVQTVGFSANRDWVKGRIFNPITAGDYFYLLSK